MLSCTTIEFLWFVSGIACSVCHLYSFEASICRPKRRGVANIINPCASEHQREWRDCLNQEGHSCWEGWEVMFFNCLITIKFSCIVVWVLSSCLFVVVGCFMKCWIIPIDWSSSSSYLCWFPYWFYFFCASNLLYFSRSEISSLKYRYVPVNTVDISSLWVKPFQLWRRMWLCFIHIRKGI